MPENNVNTETGEVIEEVELDMSLLPSAGNNEIDIQIATAKQYPRSITAFQRQAKEMATLDAQTAGSMFYILPRGGKKIEGPSVRLAEVAGTSWGNMRYAAKIVDVGDKFITAEGMAYDLEKNVAACIQVRRRITDSRGKRYNDDMIQVTGNAACSIALRNAIFKVVPFSFIKGIYEEAKQVSLGKGLTIEQKRANCLTAFKEQGIDEHELLQLAEVKGIDDLSVDKLIELRGMLTAIKDGEVSVQSLLSGGVEQPRSKIQAKIEEAQESPESDEPPEPTPEPEPKQEKQRTKGVQPKKDASQGKSEPENELKGEINASLLKEIRDQVGNLGIEFAKIDEGKLYRDIMQEQGYTDSSKITDVDAGNALLDILKGELKEVQDAKASE